MLHTARIQTPSRRSQIAMPHKRETAGHVPAPASAPATAIHCVTVCATIESRNDRRAYTSTSPHEERSVAAAGCRPWPARCTSPATPCRAPAATERPPIRPAPRPHPVSFLFPSPASSLLHGCVCAGLSRAALPRETDPRSVPKAARRSSGAAARVGPFPGSPGLAGRAFRARAAPGPARARARMREAEFGRSGDAAFGPFSPEVEIPEKLFDAARTPKNMQPMPSNADNCRTFRYAPQPRSVTAAWRSHHWSAGPKAAAGIRPCRLVIERHNSGAWIRAKTSAQGAVNRHSWEIAFPCTYSSVTICQYMLQLQEVAAPALLLGSAATRSC